MKTFTKGFILGSLFILIISTAMYWFLLKDYDPKIENCQYSVEEIKVKVNEDYITVCGYELIQVKDELVQGYYTELDIKYDKISNQSYVLMNCFMNNCELNLSIKIEYRKNKISKIEFVALEDLVFSRLGE